MLPFELTTYNGSQAPDEKTVYILMKGNNAGKPSRLPFRNSLVIICNTPEESERAFTAASAIHHSQTFRNYLIGSVIPFLRVPDVKIVYNTYSHLFTTPKPEAHKVLTTYLQLSENLQQKQSIVKQLIVGYARKLMTV